MQDRAVTAQLQALADLQTKLQTLQGSHGPKALLRRFGELLHQSYGVTSFDCIKTTMKSAAGVPSFKRRVLRAEGTETMADEILSAVTQVMEQSAEVTQDFADGFAVVSVGGQPYHIFSVEDPRSQRESLVLWQDGKVLASQAAVPLKKDHEQVLRSQELATLVRFVQNECRWFRRLEKTQAMLYQDDLTGLFNHRYLEIALASELRRAGRFQTQFCLLFLDLDGFKPINDQHGHHSGSSVLKQVAEVLRDAVREVDIPIRYGGDEFVVVLLGATCAKGVLAAERVRRSIANKEFILDGGVKTRLTASIGVAAYPDHGQNSTTLLKVADETMYDSKRNGKNKVTVFRSEHEEQKTATKDHHAGKSS